MNILRLPLFVRQFIFDALFGVTTSIVLLNLAIPGSLSEAKAELLTVGIVVLKSVARALTLAVPGFLAFARTFLSVPSVEAAVVTPSDDAPDMAPGDDVAEA